MTLRTITRCATVLAVVFTAAATAATIFMPGASALEQDRIVVKQNSSGEYEFAPIVGMNPGGTVDSSIFYQPDACATATGCDVIPLTIEPPTGADADAEYFVSIELRWDTVTLDNTPLLGQFTVTNDLDMYVQNDPLVENAGPDEDGYAYKSATASIPERVLMHRPAGDWNILIVNYLGANTGYTLTITSSVDEVPELFESLPPEFRGSSDTPKPLAITTPPPVTEPPLDLSDVAPAEPAAPNLAPLEAPVSDAAFSSGFDDGPDLSDQLAAPVERAVRRTPQVQLEPPSGLALALWMLALPLVLLAIGAALLKRRQERLLVL